MDCGEIIGHHRVFSGLLVNDVSGEADSFSIGEGRRYCSIRYIHDILELGNMDVVWFTHIMDTSIKDEDIVFVT